MTSRDKTSLTFALAEWQAEATSLQRLRSNRRIARPRELSRVKPARAYLASNSCSMASCSMICSIIFCIASIRSCIFLCIFIIMPPIIISPP